MAMARALISADPLDAGAIEALVLDPANGRAVLAMLDLAVEGIEAGWFEAMVTAPLQKSTINDAGVAFSGHTEYLADQTGAFAKGNIWLKVNGSIKQNADLGQMIWSVAEQIAKLSEAFELMPGDIIYSGTPENVGPVVRGDVIEMHIDGLPNLSVKIV